MYLYYAAVVIFAFLLLITDFNYLPHEIMKHVWNVLLFGFSIYLVIRMRRKIKMGSFEKLQKEYLELKKQMEEKQFASINSRILELEKRISLLEGKR